MSRDYEPKRDWKVGILFLAPPVILLIFALTVDGGHRLFLVCLAFCLLSLFTWIWFGTTYRLDEEHLTYRSGFSRGKIAVKDITEINPHVRAWVGNRPALSFRHLRIRYNSYDDVFIAPKEEEAFIEDLWERNPEIVVRESSVY